MCIIILFIYHIETDRENHMEETIAISDVLVSFFRHFKKIFIFAVALALLLGVLQGVIEIRKALNPAEEDARNEYERDLLALEKTIERSQLALENEREYINDSLWMGLNPYNTYRARIILNVENVEIPKDMVFGQDTNPLDYISNRILNQYVVGWSNLVLPDVIGLTKYTGVEERYLRELVSISTSLGTITITAYESSEADANALATAAYKLITDLTSDVATRSYNHTLVQSAASNKQQISEDIINSQEAHYDKVDGYINRINVAEEDKRKLDAPDSPAVSIIKKIIIGGLAGGVLSAFYYVMKDLFHGTLQSASQLSVAIGLDCLGSLVSESHEKSGFKGRIGKLLDTLIDVLAGEKKYRNSKESLNYLANMTSNTAGQDKLLISSTLDLDESDEAVSKIIKAVKDKGVRAAFSPAISTDPSSLEKLKAADSLMLLESPGKSNCVAVKEAKALADKMGKKTIGFVLI